MKKQGKKLRINKSEIVKFIKFNFVGIINTLLSFVIFWILNKLQIRVEFCEMLAYSAGVLNSWIWNSRWTFKDKAIHIKKITVFIAVNLIAMGVSAGIIKYCTGSWGIDAMIAKIIATPFSLIVNFAGNRFLVFAKSAKNKNNQS